jgi:hypothetical protein
MRLDPGEAERIAALVAEALRREPPPRYLDAAATARLLSVERGWVYEHAEELGGIRLGGARGRLRFDRRRVCDRLAAGKAPGLSGSRKPDRPITGAAAACNPLRRTAAPSTRRMQAKTRRQDAGPRGED